MRSVLLLVAVSSAAVGDTGRPYLHVPSWTRAADLVVLVDVRSCERQGGGFQASCRVAAVLKGQWDEPDISFGMAAATTVGVTGLAFLMQGGGRLVSLDNYGMFGQESPLLKVRPAPQAAWPTTGLARIRQLLEATVTGGVGAERSAAADQLGHMAPRPATTALLARVAGERGADLLLRGTCVASLLRLRAAGSVGLAADYLEASRDDHASQEQRENVVYDLAQTTPADSDFEPLVKLAGDQKAHVRAAAAEALGRTFDPRAIPVLVPMLADADAAVSRRVMESLSELVGQRDYAPATVKERQSLDYWRQWWRAEEQPAFAAPAAEGRP